MWYVLFIVFVTYAMLPLPLRCCIIAGCTTALLHIIATSIVKFNKDMVRNLVKSQFCNVHIVQVDALIRHCSFHAIFCHCLFLQTYNCVFIQLTTMFLLYTAVNFAGMYTKYLTDRSQRRAFLETHRSTEARLRTQKENDQQEKLLLSGKGLHNLYSLDSSLLFHFFAW